MHKPFVFGAIAAAALVPFASATTQSFQASHDNSLYQNTDFSDGAGPTMFVGTTDTRGSVRRALIEFDLSSIPAGATINSASLTLYFDRTIFGPTNVSLFKSLRDWGEGTSNAGVNGGQGVGATTSDATWTYSRFNSQTWTTPGGDFAPGASASKLVGDSTAYGFVTWNGAGMVGDIQSWVNGGSSNFGWEILGDESNNGTAKRFVTREGADVSQRPVLLVDYTVPAPGAAAVLGLGVPVLMRRRRER